MQHQCNSGLLASLYALADEGAVIDMEEKFCSVTLDIIGNAVFNYDFRSASTESPVVKVRLSGGETGLGEGSIDG